MTEYESVTEFVTGGVTSEILALPVQVIKGMRNGIYKFPYHILREGCQGDCQGQGRRDQGLISNRVYVTERSAKTVWRLKAYRYGYASETQGVSMRGNEAILDGDESEDRFALEGIWDGDTSAKVAIEGVWLHALP